ncbi:MAG: hypothetical protein PHG02_00305 [Oscillospiraceae bacterium]|nr:hypothetical protein [Oscillospiraceae bacterium]
MAYVKGDADIAGNGSLVSSGKGNNILTGSISAATAQAQKAHQSAAAAQSPAAQSPAAANYNAAPAYDAMAAYMALVERQRAQRQAQLQAQAAVARQSIETAFAQSTRKQYISNEQAKLAMPQQNKLAGAGGLTETANLRLETGYQEGLRDLYKQKLAALAGVESDLAKENMAAADTYYENMLSAALKHNTYLQGLQAKAASAQSGAAQTTQQAQQAAYTAAKNAAGGQYNLSYSLYGGDAAYAESAAQAELSARINSGIITAAQANAILEELNL